MKTLKQHKKQQAMMEETGLKFSELKLAGLRKRFEELDRKTIWALDFTHQSTRDEWRDALFYSNDVKFCGVACDDCGTELAADFGRKLASLPPQNYVGCVCCGWHGSTSGLR